jgi:hypothetical protein
MRAGDELTGGRQVRRLCEVKGAAAFAPVEVLEQSATCGVGDPGGERAPPAERISGGRLDLGDLGTEVHEKLCGVRTCDLGGDFDDV